jgi:hypothetical protein
MNDESKVTRYLSVLAVLVAVAALARVVSPDYVARLDGTTLQYLLVAGALLLLPRVKSLAYGDLKLEMEQTKQAAEAATATAQGASQRATEALIAAEGGVGGSRSTASTPEPGSASVLAKEIRSSAQDPDDPQKGLFGGNPEAEGRRLEARVTRTSGRRELFHVALWVHAVDRARPLSGPVVFHLHDTFRPSVRTVEPVGGIARLDLIAWGAFTVGAVADGGATRLELDLADLAEAPEPFRAR